VIKRTQNASSQLSTAFSRPHSVKWRHFWVTSGYFQLCDVISVMWLVCRSSNASKMRVLAFYSLFEGTSGHFRSRDVISFLLIDTELQPCRRWNKSKMRVLALLQPSPGHIRWNDITSGSLPAMWHHFLLRNYQICDLPVGAQMHQKCEFSLSTVFLRALPVTFAHVTSFPFSWLTPPSCSPVGAETNPKPEFSAFYSLLHATSGEMMLLADHFQSFPSM